MPRVLQFETTCCAICRLQAIEPSPDQYEFQSYLALTVTNRTNRLVMLSGFSKRRVRIETYIRVREFQKNRNREIERTLCRSQS